MTSNPLQPLTPRDGSMPQSGSTAGSHSQTGSQSNPKSPQGAGARDEGNRSFRSTPEAAAAGAARTGGSAEVLGYLNSISEFVTKCRKALGGSSTDDTRQASDRQGSDRQGSDRQSSDRQGNDRQANEGGSRSSPSEDTERNRNASSPL